MKLTPHIYLVGSGKWGFSISNSVDCNVYLIDTGEGFVLIDSGCGMENGRIEENIRSHGFTLKDLKAIFLTHYHADHACGAQGFHEKSGCAVFAPAPEAEAVRLGDEQATSLAGAKGHSYPLEYEYRACPCVQGAENLQKLRIGDVEFTFYHVPGHSLCDMAVYAEIDGKNCLFSGDAVFAGGEILLQSLYDVSIKPYYDAVKTLASLPIDALFPGHALFSLHDAGWHVKKCLEGFDSGLVPKQLHYFG